MLPIRCLTPATPSTSAPATPSGVTLATSSSCCNDANHSQPSDTQALKLTGNATGSPSDPVLVDQHWTHSPTPRWPLEAAQQGQPYLWSCHPYPYLDPCWERLQDAGAAHCPSHCWQAEEQAQDPNHLERAPWGKNLALFSARKAAAAAALAAVRACTPGGPASSASSSSPLPPLRGAQSTQACPEACVRCLGKMLPLYMHPLLWGWKCVEIDIAQLVG
ncbi:MAG: hypothetical protein FRX49_04075 [Trebouxia sp. A1-2]|nr:MAG: hypothetical protein FRX49_04075 [Trebouxia sp. A1-2]